MTDRVRRTALYVLLTGGALIMVFPFLWTIMTSITPGATLTTTPQLIPDNPSLSPYVELFDRVPFGRIIVNSLDRRDRGHAAAARDERDSPRTSSRGCPSAAAARCSPSTSRR